MKGGIPRVIIAEWTRRWSLHPISTLMSAVIFPALMVTVLFYLPTADLLGQRLDLLKVAVSWEGSTEGAEAPSWAEPIMEALEDQPIYGIIPTGDAKAAFHQGEASVGVMLTAPGPNGEPPGVEILRGYDLLSDLLFDRLEVRIHRDIEPLLLPVTEEEEKNTQDARGHLARVGLFILLGFAWFFTSSGVIERFVAERERRTLESLLSTAIEPGRLLRGRLLEICIHGALPQIACGSILLALGFSPYSLCLPLIVCFTLYPFALLCFWLLRNTEDMVSAGWRTGVSFMFGFPLVILTSDVLGTLSPFYQIAKALSGPPAWDIYLPALLSLMAVTALGWGLTGRIAKGWQV